ncbi:Gamma-glutamyl phosphate reductase [Rhodanobacter lindaniclasticus]
MHAATDDDYAAEFLDLILAVRVVDDLDDAIAHIHRYGSDHTEVIATADEAAAEHFVQAIRSAVVTINASSRFSDGGELGLGAEIGISTTRLHALRPDGWGVDGGALRGAWGRAGEAFVQPGLGGISAFVPKRTCG